VNKAIERQITGGTKMGRKSKIFFPLCLMMMWSASLFGQMDIKLNGIGGHVGYVIPEGAIENTIAIGAQADLGKITEKIFLGAFVDYWGKSYDAGIGLGSTAEWSWSEIVIGPLAKYYFSKQSKFQFYTGGGLGLAIGNWKWKYDDPYLGHQESSDSKTEIAIYFVAGAEQKLSQKMIGYLEAKYHTGGADYIGIFAGVTFLLNTATNQ
jgi:hypothetical protein